MDATLLPGGENNNSMTWWQMCVWPSSTACLNMAPGPQQFFLVGQHTPLTAKVIFHLLFCHCNFSRPSTRLRTGAGVKYNQTFSETTLSEQATIVVQGCQTI